MVGRGHRLLGGPVGRARHIVFVAVTGRLVIVMMAVMMVPGRVAGRRGVVQLRVQLERGRYRGRMIAGSVVTAGPLIVVTVRPVTDGHHVVRGPAGTGGRVRRRRIGGPGTRRCGRVQVRRRRVHQRTVSGGLLLLVAATGGTGEPDRPIELSVTVRRRQQLLF